MNLRTVLVSGALATSASFASTGALAGDGRCNYDAKGAEASARVVTVSNEAEAKSNFNARDYIDAPLKIEISRSFNESPDTVFAAIADHEGWVNWLPTLDKVSVDHSNSVTPGVNGAGTVRECLGGKNKFIEYVRYLDASERIMAYAVDMQKSTGGFPFNDHLGVLSVTAGADGGSVVTWKQYIDVQKGLKGKIVVPMLKHRFMKKGLKNLDKHLDKSSGALVRL